MYKNDKRRWINYTLIFFSSRRRHTRSKRDWSSDVCSSDLAYKYYYHTHGRLRKHHLHIKTRDRIWIMKHFLSPRIDHLRIQFAFPSTALLSFVQLFILAFIF